MPIKIPFNKPYMVGKELWYIAKAHHAGHLAGAGEFTQLCQRWLENTTGARKALLTHSCTAALEMAAVISDIQPGDEVILPSYTFVSTASAFAIRGGVPVFVDIREDTLNIDESLIEKAITPRTKAIIPVHYAGVACEMDTIMEIAERHNLLVIEDAAQGLMASYKGRALGTIGHLGTVSFHETKNIISGEGGALFINDQSLIERAEIVWEKGTNRRQFFRGEVDKYTWVGLGSSYLPSELVAAFLYAQMEEADNITQQRLSLWDTYHSVFAGAEVRGKLRRPIISDECIHNAHMYYILMPTAEKRQNMIEVLKRHGVHAVFHYIPLHSSPAGKKYGRAFGAFDVTDSLSERIVRLPMWVGLREDQGEVIARVLEVADEA
jgi:dTDP-4-amino-4,6-dideoxygalactose transaminase